MPKRRIPIRISQPRRSKFNAVRTTVDGITFDSKKEAKRYGDLKQLEKVGLITKITLQPRFPLGVSGGVMLGEYVADFMYFMVNGGTRVIEDVKGFKTPLYRWKKKHFEAQYGIKITEL